MHFCPFFRVTPAWLVLATPVAPVDALAGLRAEADEIVCLLTPEPFDAVGAHYADFTQTSNEEVVGLLRLAWDEDASPAPPTG